MQFFQAVVASTRVLLLALAGVLLLFRSAKDWFAYKESLERASYPPRVSAALDLLAAAGVRRYRAAPSYCRMLWRRGFVVPPPHFAGLLTHCTTAGIGIGVATWMFLFALYNAPPERFLQFLAFAVAAGLLAAVARAAYYRRAAARYHLPPWSSLPDGATPGRRPAWLTRLVPLAPPVVYLFAAVGLCFWLGVFAPNINQVKGTAIAETPLVDVAGHKHTFRELRGKATTLYFWATWCGPCLSHMSDLSNGQRLPANEPFLPVAVESDPKAVTAMLKRLGYHGAVWVATDGQALLLRRFAGNDKHAVPFVVKLDAAGTILEARYGDSAVIANDPVKTCRNDGNDDAKPRVAACTTLISKSGASAADIADAYWHRARAYERLDDKAHALADLDAFLLHRPDNARALAMRGYMHGVQGDTDLAIADVEQSIRLDGGSAPAFGNLGTGYFHKRDFDRAEVNYGHAIDMSKDDTYAWAHRCFTRAVIGKHFDAALADCDEAMKLRSTATDPGELAEVLGFRCFAHYRMKHFREAVQDCDTAIAHNATYAEALYVRGLAKRALGDASASDDIGQARKIDPKISATYAGYGVPETP